MTWKRRFLESLREHGQITAACITANIDKSTAYAHKKTDPEFAAAWEAALEEATDEMVIEAKRRAVKGVTEPVFYRGDACGAVQKYSDVLLMFLIKKERPEYRDARIETPSPEDKERRIIVPGYDPRNEGTS